MKRRIPLIAVVGESGSGKTSITQMSTLDEVVSYTSRPINADNRTGEVDGVDYHFKSEEWMVENKDKFNLDYKEIHGFRYGATDKDLQSKDAIIIYARDAVELKEIMPVHIVWVIRDNPTIRAGRIEPDLLKYVNKFDSIIHNNGPIEDAVLRLELINNLIISEVLWKGDTVES
jgi:ribose 1,5-bisphosphokinase PhnN